MSPSSSSTPSTSSPSTYPTTSRGGASNQHTPTSLTAAGAAKGATSRSSSPYIGDTPQGGASHHNHPHHTTTNINNNNTTTNTSPAYAFGHNRSLHIKLSSPDRKRATSPSEVKSRQEARQLSAEANRDRTIAERKMKAMLVSEKVRRHHVEDVLIKPFVRTMYQTNLMHLTKHAWIIIILVTSLIGHILHHHLLFVSISYRIISTVLTGEITW